MDAMDADLGLRMKLGKVKPVWKFLRRLEEGGNGRTKLSALICLKWSVLRNYLKKLFGWQIRHWSSMFLVHQGAWFDFSILVRLFLHRSLSACNTMPLIMYLGIRESTNQCIEEKREGFVMFSECSFVLQSPHVLVWKEGISFLCCLVFAPFSAKLYLSEGDIERPLTLVQWSVPLVLWMRFGP